MINPYFLVTLAPGAVEYFKFFEKLFDFVKAHIKRQLYFVDRCLDVNFFTAPYCARARRVSFDDPIGLCQQQLFHLADLNSQTH